MLYWTVTCKRSVRSKFSATWKFVRFLVHVAENGLRYFIFLRSDARWKVLTKTFPRFLPQRQKGNIGRHLWDGVDILRSFYAKDKPTLLPAIHQELGVSGNLWLAFKMFDVSFTSEEGRSFNIMDWIPYYYKISNIKISKYRRTVLEYGLL